MVHRLALFGVVSLALACGDGKEGPPDEGPRPAVERRAFELISGSPQELANELVTRIPIPPSLGDDCRASNDTVELLTVHTLEGERPAIRFREPAVETNVRILHRFRGGVHDAVRLTIATEGTFLLRVIAGREGRSVSSELRPREFPPGTGTGTRQDPLATRVHELEFAALLEAEGRFSELVLHKPIAKHPITIVGIELVRRRGRSPLPPPDEPRMVSVGEDSRPAVGLTPGLVLGVALGETDEQLAFDAALTGSGSSTGTLHVRVVDASGAERQAIEVDVDRDWSAVRMVLDHPPRRGSRVLVSALGRTRALVANARVERPRATPPTVLLITSDTHRADHLGVVSPPGFVDTSNLDALAAEGVVFTNCFSAANVTNPSHASVMTGVHPRDTGILDNISRLAGRAQTLAECFSEAGWATFAAVSAQHLSSEYAGLGQGFDRMGGPAIVPRDSEITVAALERWLPDAAGLPLFVWLHLFDAHGPYEVPPELERRYYPAGRDPRDPLLSLGLHPGQVQREIVNAGITDIEYPPAQYRAEVDYLDACLATLLARPRIASGIVAFTADHGESLGEQGVWWDHEPLYPSTLHVPLILRWPGCPRNLRIDAPVETVDVGRTLLDLAGLETTAFPGRSLRWALVEPDGHEPRLALAAHGMTASMEQGGWYFVLHLRAYASKLSLKQHRVGEAYLYDLTADPSCQVDLLLPELPRATRMRAQLLAWLEDAAPGDLRETDPVLETEQIAVLAGLGYTGAATTPRGRWWDPESADRDWESSRWRRLFEDPEFARESLEALGEH